MKADSLNLSVTQLLDDESVAILLDDLAEADTVVAAQAYDGTLPPGTPESESRSGTETESASAWMSAPMPLTEAEAESVTETETESASAADKKIDSGDAAVGWPIRSKATVKCMI